MKVLTIAATASFSVGGGVTESARVELEVEMDEDEEWEPVASTLADMLLDRVKSPGPVEVKAGLTAVN